MRKIQVTINDKVYEYDFGVTFESIARDFQKDYKDKIVLANVNGKYKELHKLLSDDCNVEFLFYYLLHNRARIISLGSGAGQPNISQQIVKDLQLSRPPLPEQRRIAAALGDVDRLIENLKKRVEKKKNLKRGAMQELLTGKRRLKGFTGAWVEKRLGEMLKIGNGRDYKHLGAGDVPVYGTGGLMTYVDDFLFEGTTVCFGRKGTIDEPQYHEGKIWTVDTLYFTYDFIDADPKWLYYRSLLIDWLSYNTASGVPSLTAKAIYGISVLVPPLPEQRAIAAVLSDMDAEIANLETKLKKMTLLKQGVMQDLLTGKVRLA